MSGFEGTSGIDSGFIIFSLHLFIYYVCVRECVCITVKVWRPEDDFQESILCFHHVSPRGGTQVQAWWQTPSPAEPSHWPQALFKSMCFVILK